MPETTAPPTASKRRADLDWLRVLAVLLLVPYHGALVFNLDPNAVVFVKDVVHSPALAEAVGFVHTWHMPLLFAIAGAASWFALGWRSGGEYLRERVLRLLVPFVFGVLTLVPLMLNVHWLGRPDAPTLGEMYSRFLTFNPNDLSGTQGTFAPGHLWFIGDLLLFSLLALPLFLALRRPGAQHLLGTLHAGRPLRLARGSMAWEGMGAKAGRPNMSRRQSVSLSGQECLVTMQ
jgi:glucan biosynthesis protein C